MTKCSFCRKNIEPGTGIMFIKNDGRVFNFCAAKCEKHLLVLKHKPRLTKWSGAYEPGAKNSEEKTPAASTEKTLDNTEKKVQ